jgi:Domain of unknown function (DUF1830)
MLCVFIGVEFTPRFIEYNDNHYRTSVKMQPQRVSIPKRMGELQMSLRCSYTNTTASVQIARIADLPNGYLERVVFPEACLLFEASGSARLEIHTGTVVSAIVLDRIPCDRLAFSAKNRLAFPVENRLSVQRV